MNITDWNLMVLKNVDTESETHFPLSDVAANICHWIIFTVLCQAIDMFGIVTNIINIISFVKQGFRDPVNVSLLGLAFSDLGCLSTLLVTNICFTPAFSASDLPFDAIEFTYLTSSMPHIALTHVTGWITALITLERCLCITMPLKIKRIVTTKRVSLIVVIIFIILTSSAVPVYLVNKLEMKFVGSRNKTVLGLVYTENRENVEMVSFAINNAFIPFSAFLVIIACTGILVWKLQESAKWRMISVTSAQVDSIFIRNQKVAKMVVMISTLFIVCFIPVSIIFIAMSLMPELSFYGRYRNVLTVIGGFGFVMESINSSVNIFIYYQMSSKYRAVFRQLFCMETEHNLKIDNL